MCKANQFYTVNETEGNQFSMVCHLKFGYYRGQVFLLKIWNIWLSWNVFGMNQVITHPRSAVCRGEELYKLGKIESGSTYFVR